MAEKFTKSQDLEKLGEFGLINELTKQIELKNTSSVVGVGDDAAVLDYSGSKIVVTNDLLMEGIHFNLAYTPLKHLGYKAVVVNVSDIYAMNATPKQIVIGIAFSNRFTTKMIQEIYEGIYLACEKYGVDVVGGDTTSSHAGLAISITALGEVNGEPVRRNTAKKNDVICVTGDLGGAYMGLQLLERENKVFQDNPQTQPDFSGFSYILGRQLKPEARKDVKSIFDELKITPSAMIDISDGLSSELMHICTQSKVGCKIFADKIPLAAETIKLALDFEMEPLIAALNGGEDYELLFTIPVSEIGKIENHPDITAIGHITEEDLGYNMITPEGQFIELKAQGWNAFGTK